MTTTSLARKLPIQTPVLGVFDRAIENMWV